MKKLMILGGSENQLSLIKCAKEQSYTVVLCDYAEDNIGKNYADIFYCVSTLDKQAILEVAKIEEIDGIITNSEPAVPVASYVGNELGLPSNPYESVVILSRKDLFRKFLRNNGFNCPQSYDTDDYNYAIEKISSFQFPLMVKPIDSSGSRGVSRINSVDELKAAFNIAMRFSKMKRVLVEEYIERTHDYMIGGDIFVLDGKVEFWGLMNCLRDDSINVFVPVGKSFPVFINNDQFAVIKNTINSILKLLNIRFGAFNVELMFGENNRLFLIEMNPRNGGNRIPEILEIITGVDLIRSTIEASLGLDNLPLSHDVKEKFVSTYILHSEYDGVLKDINFSENIKGNVFKISLNEQIGDRVEKFINADKLIGIVFLQFDSLEEMKYKLEHIKELIKVKVE
jgi:biotin carboxylase